MGGLCGGVIGHKLNMGELSHILDFSNLNDFGKLHPLFFFFIKVSYFNLRRHSASLMELFWISKQNVRLGYHTYFYGVNRTRVISI